MRPAPYLAALLAAALLAGIAAYAGSWAASVAGCRMLAPPDAYLAYCDTPSFGSYEHEAYALHFEPAAVRAMRRAQVLFLGNSRVQFAFSTPETDRFFAARGISYHLLGFGFGESSAFPRYLFTHDPPHPKVVIINADPFFQPVLSPAADAMFGLRRGAYTDALLKKAFGRLQPALCALGLCPQTVPSTYRDIRTGQWIWQGALLPADTVTAAIRSQKALSWPRSAVPAWQADATSFLAMLNVPRACVILTGIPTPAIDAEGMAAALGQRLGLPVVQPVVSGLFSLDNSHLSGASARRWSAAFLAQAAPIIDRCIGSGDVR